MYEDTRERQIIALCLPAGVSMDQMKEIWENMSFHPPSEDAYLSQDLATFNPSHFRKASPAVKWLRKVAHDGRLEAERIALSEAGKPKIVWGDDANPELTDSSAAVDSASKAAPAAKPNTTTSPSGIILEPFVDPAAEQPSPGVKRRMDAEAFATLQDKTFERLEATLEDAIAHSREKRQQEAAAAADSPSNAHSHS